MRKIVVGVLSLVYIFSLPISAQAGFQGSKCSNSGATISNGGIDYACKKVNGKLKWQKKPNKPALTEAQKQKLWTNCVVSLIGTAGFSNDDLINSAYICRQRLGFGY